MSIGLICAIPQEHRHLSELLDGQQTFEVGPLHFAAGRLEGRDVVLARAGIGKVNTAMTATILSQRFGAETVVFSGVAGGLDPALTIGDVVVGIKTTQHDAGVIEHETLASYQPGHVPFFNPTDKRGYATSEALVAKVRDRLRGLKLTPLSAAAGGQGLQPKVVFGTVVSGDQYVNCETTRERLFRTFDAQAVEMEGGALGQVGETLGFDWLDIRALSDLAGTSSRHDFNHFVVEVAAHAATILRRLLPVL